MSPYSSRSALLQPCYFRYGATPPLLREIFPLNDRQKQAIQYLKTHARITNSEYQESTGASRATASRELDALLAKGVLEKVGTTGKGTHYMLANKRITKDS